MKKKVASHPLTFTVYAEDAFQIKAIQAFLKALKIKFELRK